MVSVWNGSELTAREMLVTLKRSGWPARAHIWTEKLTPDQMRVAEKIVSSFATIPAQQ